MVVSYRLVISHIPRSDFIHLVHGPTGRKEDEERRKEQERTSVFLPSNHVFYQQLQVKTARSLTRQKEGCSSILSKTPHYSPHPTSPARSPDRGKQAFKNGGHGWGFLLVCTLLWGEFFVFITSQMWRVFATLSYPFHTPSSSPFLPPP